MYILYIIHIYILYIIYIIYIIHYIHYIHYIYYTLYTLYILYIVIAALILIVASYNKCNLLPEREFPLKTSLSAYIRYLNAKHVQKFTEPYILLLCAQNV